MRQAKKKDGTGLMHRAHRLHHAGAAIPLPNAGAVPVDEPLKIVADITAAGQG